MHAGGDPSALTGTSASATLPVAGDRDQAARAAVAEAQRALYRRVLAERAAARQARARVAELEVELRAVRAELAAAPSAQELTEARLELDRLRLDAAVGAAATVPALTTVRSAGGPDGAAAERRLVVPRVVEDRDRSDAAWLRPALERLAMVDRPAAIRLFEALLAGLGHDVGRSDELIVHVEGHHPLRVGLDDGRPPTPVDLTPSLRTRCPVVTGSLEALAPLVTGGVRWRLPGVRVSGPRGPLRAALRARRRPSSLARIADLPVDPPPRDLLAALAQAVDPAWTAGHRFAVVFDVDGERTAVELAEGAPPRVGAPTAEPAVAVVSVSRVALPAVLARVAPPAGEQVHVEGRETAVAVLDDLLDRAQGLPPRH